MEDVRFPPLRDLDPQASGPQLGHRFPPIAAAAQPSSRGPSRDTIRGLMIGGALVFGIIWLIGIHSVNGLVAMLDYLALAASVFCWSCIALSAATRRWSPMLAQRYPAMPVYFSVALGLVVAVWWAGNDTYVNHWTHPEAGDFDDTVYRFGTHGIHRVRHPKETAGIVYQRFEGDLSPSGQLHGEWVTTTLRKGGTFTTEHQWYWYGEEITEGEWHLRNR